MAANHSPFLIDLIANAIHWLYKQGYGAIVYDRDQVADLNALGQEMPLAFLPSHRSNLDRLSAAVPQVGERPPPQPHRRAGST